MRVLDGEDKGKAVGLANNIRALLIGSGTAVAVHAVGAVVIALCRTVGISVERFCLLMIDANKVVDAQRKGPN